MLTAARAEDVTATGVAERLRSLLDRAHTRSTADGAASVPGGAPVTARLESATADELLDFIDQELS